MENYGKPPIFHGQIHGSAMGAPSKSPGFHQDQSFTPYAQASGMPEKPVVVEGSHGKSPSLSICNRQIIINRFFVRIVNKIDHVP